MLVSNFFLYYSYLNLINLDGIKSPINLYAAIQYYSGFCEIKHKIIFQLRPI